MTDKKPIVEMKNITKKFPGVTALSDVDFKLFPGEIHGIMGENGAGKSTLIKVLTGVYKPENGEIRLEGNSVNVRSPQHAQELGISTVYQEVNLCLNLSVAENIFIGREPMKKGRIDWQAMEERANEILKKFNLNIDVSRDLSFYSVAIQQMVAIARALEISAKVIILDEPTASLDKNETEKLFEVMRQLRSEDIGLIYITHFLDNVYEITDRITVLREGKLVDVRETGSFSRLELISKMIGRNLEEIEKLETKAEEIIGEEKGTFLQAFDLGRKGTISPFDLEVKKGEVLGIAGLLGSGRTELVELLFGLTEPDQGKILIDDNEVNFSSPQDAIKRGISFCPEDRQEAGLIGELTVRENIILALQVTRGWFNFISPKEQKEIANRYIDLIDIKTPDADQLVKNLSGGNQQKVVLARWLVTDPDLLILDEPTRGIDVGTKADIQKLVLSLAEEEMGVIFISSEIEEVERVSQKVAVMRDREKIAELTGEDVDQDKIMYEIAGREE